MGKLTSEQGLLLIASISMVVYRIIAPMLREEEELKYALIGIHWLVWLIAIKVIVG